MLFKSLKKFISKRKSDAPFRILPEGATLSFESFVHLPRYCFINYAHKFRARGERTRQSFCQRGFASYILYTAVLFGMLLMKHAAVGVGLAGFQ